MSSSRTHQPSPSSSDPPPPPPPTHRRNNHPPQPHRKDAVPRVAKALLGEEEEEERDGTSYPREETGRVSALSGGKAAHGVGESSSTSMERNRREKMNEMYMVLQSMVPNLFPRAPRAKIVEETVNYIEELEGAIRVLEEAKKARKRARMSSTASSVDVTVSGKMAFFGVSSTWRPGLAARVLQAFDNDHAEVLAATVAYDGGGQKGSISQTMNLTVTAMADEAAVEGVEEELTTILS